MRHGIPPMYKKMTQEDEISDNTLPPLPRNGKYVRHTNECFDWGTVGWAIKEGHAQPHLYKYFIVMNSSVRGPFLPPYWPVCFGGFVVQMTMTT